jgi:hypothetical protein
MGLKLTETELNNLLNKNSKLKVAKETKSNNKKTSKITLVEKDLVEEKKIKKAQGIKTSEVNKLNKQSTVHFSSSDNHVSILFEGAKLLSVNQIFAILQYRKYEIFTYKKIWHELIKKVLDEQSLLLRSENKKLPFFNEAVEITLFRQASRLVDEDAMSTMFKYIIDGLKRDETDNPNGILAEDNPKIVHRIVCYSEKGEPFVGIKVKKISEKKSAFSPTDILKK